MCLGATTTLSDTTVGGTWTSGTTAVATITAGGIVYGVTLGASTISYAVTNSCGTTTVTRSIAVITAPVVGAITGTTTVYTGGSTTLSDTTSGGTWTSANTLIATVNSTTGVVSAVGLGTTNISYAVTNACATTTVSRAVTVLTLVSASTATWNFTAGTTAAATSTSAFVPASTCIASVGNTNGTVTPITAVSVSSGYTGASGTNNIGNAAFTGPLSGTSSYIQFTLVPNSGYFINVSGISFGARSTGTGPAAYTIKSSADGYTAALATGTLTTTSAWALITPTFTSTATGGASAPITIRVYGHSGTGSPGAGTINWKMDDITVNYTANPNICGTPTAGSIAGASTFCGSAVDTLTFTPGTTLPGMYYEWDSSNNGTAFTAISGATSTSYITPTLTDTTYYVVKSTCGYTGLTATTAVATETVNPVPSIAIGGVPSTCVPHTSVTVAYSSPVSSPTTYDLTWSTAGTTAGFANVTGGTLPPSSIDIAIPAAGTAGTYTGTVTVSNGSCIGSPAPVSITLYPSPVTAITSAASPCVGSVTNVVISGAPGTTVRYRVDSGSVLTDTTLASGTLTISTGIVTAPHNYTLVSSSNLVCSAAIDTVAYIYPIIMQWTGGTAGHETEWNYAANWTCGTVPTVTNDITIDSSTYMPLIATSDIMNTRNLSLNTGASITVSASAVLNVKGTLTNNSRIAGDGKVVLNSTSHQAIKGIGHVNNLELNNSAGATIDTGARLIIDSTLYMTTGTLTTNDSLELGSPGTTGTARIAPLPASGADIAGKVRVDQYVPGGMRRFRFWGHPFSTAISLSQLEKYMDITGLHGSANGFTSTTSNAPSAFRLDPYTSNITMAYDPGWKAFTKIDGTEADSNKMQPGQGIRLFFRGAKGEGLGYLGYTGMYSPSPVVVKMLGTVNQGPVTIHMARGSMDTLQEYNQLANPYPSPIDIGTILYNAKLSNNINGSAFYVWNPSLGSSGQYVMVPIGTSAPSPYYIQANMSFQVRCAHDGDSINFVESNKVAGYSNYLFKMPAEYVTLNVYDASYHMWDQMRIQFNDNATDGNDNKYDATKPLLSEFNFYSLSSENIKLGIDARPFGTDKVIPLGVASAYNQDFIIRAEDVPVPTGNTLYLYDKLLEKSTALQPGTEYKFTITKDKATQGDNRFELSLKPSATTPVATNLNVTMTPNPATDAVNIHFTNAVKEDVSVRIMDVTGVSVYNKELGAQTNGTVNISLSQFAAGTYMVELTLGNHKVVKRLVKE